MARGRRATARRREERELRAGDFARIDRDRGARAGVPEVVLAEGKTTEHLRAIVRSCVRSGHGVLISRPSASQVRAVRAAIPKGKAVRVLARGRLIRVPGPLGVRYDRGVVGVLTAGTSDVPLALEAVELLRALGVRVVTAFDVGVAGLHRVLRAIPVLERANPEIYLVFAGREGALPTVVAGLVRAPVVGIPTSVGYGRGGRGEAALNAMLQSCAPIAVVNIDAAVPAALFAAQRFARPPPRSRGPVRRRGRASQRNS
jgi:pyridinium-3,5-biscarboxylic acid mononucleotide synthase